MCKGKRLRILQEPGHTQECDQDSLTLIFQQGTEWNRLPSQAYLVRYRLPQFDMDRVSQMCTRHTFNLEVCLRGFEGVYGCMLAFLENFLTALLWLTPRGRLRKL